MSRPNDNTNPAIEESTRPTRSGPPLSNTNGNEPKLFLAENHRERLSRSGVSDQVISARRYESVNHKNVLERLGFARTQCAASAMVIPLYNARGERAGVQIRPDSPRFINGKLVKYESPKGSSPVIDVPLTIRNKVLDPLCPLVITEGAIKADAAASKDIPCVSVAGVFSWKPDDPFWGTAPLRNRTVYIAFDSDQADNPNVRRAALRLYNELLRYGASPKILCLPPDQEGKKQGLDDYLAANHESTDLYDLPILDVSTVVAEQEEEREGAFRKTPTGLVHDTVKNGVVTPMPLTNFNAWITADVEIYNGSDVQRELEIAVELNGKKRVIDLPAQNFEKMDWVVATLGGGAIIRAGFQIRDYAREAIQSVSGDIPQRRVYQHLGWIKIEENWCYLHAGGAIGTDVVISDRSAASSSGICKPIPEEELSTNGPIGPQKHVASTPYEVEVRVPSKLKDYCLPPPLTGEQLYEAIHDTFAFLLGAAPSRLVLPLIAATFRIAIDKVDFSMFLVGPTNVGKTELVALFTQFFGAGLHARNLPGSWGSTANALMALMPLAKNAILPVDDFVPTGSQADMDRNQRHAEQLLRAQGNSAGRDRARSDGTLREGLASECLVVGTGESRPRGHSLNSRLFTLEIGPGDVVSSDASRSKNLTVVQRRAREGLFASVMASFLSWLAPKYEEKLSQLNVLKVENRDCFRTPEQLARPVDITAELMAGFEILMEFCVEKGGLELEWAEKWFGDLQDTLNLGLGEQQEVAEEEDPVSRYLDLLITAFTTGYANLKTTCNEVPLSRAELWGWRAVAEKAPVTDKENQDTHVEFKTVYQPLGTQIGWVNESYVYLEIDASLAVIQKLAKDSSLSPLPLTKRTLGKALQARGLLKDTTKGHFTSKITVLGIQKRVLQIEVCSFVALKDRAYTGKQPLEDILEA